VFCDTFEDGVDATIVTRKRMKMHHESMIHEDAYDDDDDDDDYTSLSSPSKTFLMFDRLNTKHDCGAFFHDADAYYTHHSQPTYEGGMMSRSNSSIVDGM
jgi:hypothetical protein